MFYLPPGTQDKPSFYFFLSFHDHCKLAQDTGHTADGSGTLNMVPDPWPCCWAASLYASLLCCRGTRPGSSTTLRVATGAMLEQGGTQARLWLKRATGKQCQLKVTELTTCGGLREISALSEIFLLHMFSSKQFDPESQLLPGRSRDPG